MTYRLSLNLENFHGWIIFCEETNETFKASQVKGTAPHFTENSYIKYENATLVLKGDIAFIFDESL